MVKEQVEVEVNDVKPAAMVKVKGTVKVEVDAGTQIVWKVNTKPI